MIVYAMITRVSDALPLSASTDLDVKFELKESKRLSKILSRKARQFPVRSILKTKEYNLSFVRAVGVSFIAITDSNYPIVLAFSFLEEIQREFVISYKGSDVEKAVRPYSFIEFDMFIQKTKQRYNNTRGMSTRLNLSDKSEDLKNNPPYDITMMDLGQDYSDSTKTFKTTAGPAKHLNRLSWIGMLACGLSGLCSFLNLLRFVPLMTTSETDDDHSLYFALCFLCSGAFHGIQCYILMFGTRRSLSVTATLFALILVFIYLLRYLRNVWQMLFHSAVALFTLHQIITTKLQEKPPDYNV